MKTNALIAFIFCLIIGVTLTLQSDLPKIASDLGGIMALVGGVGFAIWVILEVRLR